ncbi:MAG TPA: response regulator, partial [Gemmatimonadaceae bacterium]|nr:response regulator [Gemmatimonadaceae bacterium]
MRILLVEDDRSLADIIRSGLEEKEIRVVVAHTYDQGRLEAVMNPFDVIVLDVMLPGGSGFDLCAHLRKREIA